MHKVIKQIRDLEIIEEELTTNPAGVLALMINDESVTQIATTFLYLDKNIYIFFEGEDEIFDKIQFENGVTFTVLKYGKLKKRKDIEFEPTYDLFSISVSGTIKKIDEQKLLEELQQNYIKKYKKNIDDEIDLSSLARAVIVDSEEIQAFEETGG